MRWTEKSEPEIIKEWAKEEYKTELAEKYLPESDEHMVSYWESYCEANDIMEYDFSNVTEFRRLLEQYVSESYMRDLHLPLTVAALKGKRKAENIEKNVQETGKEEVLKKDAGKIEILEFVYVF